MSSRIVRDIRGYPVPYGSNIENIRTRPHRCGKSCTRHLTPKSALAALKEKLMRTEA